MIQFEDVSKSFGKTPVLKNISFRIEDGEFVVLIGPSGCGKTTTLKLINRLIEPDSGIISVNGKDISQEDRIKLRRSIGYVIQQIGLFPTMTIEKNISVVPKMLKYSRERRKQIVCEMLDLVGMPYDDYAHRYPSELSGGQQQRIGVLRALAASPPIVLMDEPFGALDPITREILQEEVRRLQKKLNKTIVFVTHDMDEALNLADKIVFMKEGSILQIASPDEILENPADELIASFMGKRIKDMEAVPQTAADIMKTKFYTAYIDQGIREAVDKMARRKVDTLLVKRQDETYAGIVSFKSIQRTDKELKKIEPLVQNTNIWSYIDEDAHTCFDKLLGGSDDYLVVLNRDETIAGIVTRTSVARSLADALWGTTDDPVL